MPNYYNCSNGERVSQATIDTRRSKTYKSLYAGEPHPVCAGCNGKAEGSAHLIPQKIAKDSGIAELCWSKENIVPACFKCNSLLESYKDEEVKKLFCYQQLLDITEKYLPQRFNKINECNNI
jgi:hypothetical protein